MSSPSSTRGALGRIHALNRPFAPAPVSHFLWAILFSFALCLTAAAMPANDNFGNRIAMAGTLPSSAAGTNVDADLEGGEPNPLGESGASVWWSWTAPSSGWVSIDTFSSDFDTKLYVFTGGSLGSLTLVKADDDSDGDDAIPGQSQVVFFATSGVNYKVAVHGYDEPGAVLVETGSIQLAITASSAPAANDDFANRTGLPGTATVSTTGSNFRAGIEVNEPDSIQGGGSSVWWSWTAPASGLVQINTINSTFDTLLYVYTGTSLGSLVEKAADDDGGGNFTSRVDFAATAGVTYQIAVHGLFGDQGSIALEITDGTAAPANNDFADRITLTSGPNASDTGSNIAATLEASEPDPLGRGGASVWWEWTPTSTGYAEIDTVGSGFDTVLYVFTGSSLGGLVEAASNDDINGTTFTSRVNFLATNGVTYKIAVHGFSGQAGPVSVNVRPGAAPPGNDDFANAIFLGGAQPTNTTGTNIAATLELSEPGPLAGMDRTVWWTWTAPFNRWYSVDTFGSSFDTAVIVYTGTDLATLVPVSIDDDDAGFAQSRAHFQATAGVNYKIAVGGVSGDSGAINLNIVNSLIPPTNDKFAGRIHLGGGATAATTGTNVTTGIEEDEPDPLFKGGSSVWWSWTAPAAGPVQIDTFGSDFDTLLYVFTGTTLTGLTPVGAGDNADGTNQSRVTFQAAAGVTYQIAVHGLNGLEGSVSLAIGSAPPLPANDLFANRISLPGSAPVSTTGSNISAGVEIDEPDPLDDGGASVWWEWTAPSSGWFRVGTGGSTFDTILYVFSGSTVSTLNAIAFADAANGTQQAETFFLAAAGESYQIAVHGDKGVTGAISLEIAASAAPPANDNFLNRISLPSNSNVGTSGTNTTAGIELNEPDYLGGGASVWWEWTAPSTGWFEIDTFGSSFDTLLYVFSGNVLSTLVPIGLADEAANSQQSRVTFQATVGVSYQIAVHGDRGERGSISLSIAPGIPAPANDNFANRESMGGGTSASRFGSNVSAGIEVDEPDPLSEGGASVWWEWTAPSNSYFRVETFGSSFDTVLYVFDGPDLQHLTTVGSNDDAGGSNQSQVNFFATFGVTYKFAVHGVDGQTGSINIVLGTGSEPPQNDNFINRIGLPSNPSTGTTGSNVAATLEPNEPNPSFGGASVWWKWTAPADGWVQADTFGSSPLDSVLCVFTGASIDALTLVGSSDNANGTNDALVNFFATSGVEYQLGVYGEQGETGPVSLQISPGTPPPANDDFANRLTLPSSFSTSTAATNTASTLELNEPDSLGGGASVWWEWTAPAGGGWTEINTVGSAFDTILYLFTGSTLTGLTEVAANDDAAGSSSSKINFLATGGVTYKIAVHGNNGDTGSILLNVTSGSPNPNNDDFAGKIDMGSVASFAASGSNVAATTEGSEPDPIGRGGTSVWWKWTAPSTGYFQVDTLTSTFDTILYVFTGPDLANLVAEGGNDDGGGTSQSLVNFSATLGTDYYFAVHGRRGLTGTVNLNLGAGVTPPANDNFANAAILPSVAVTSTTGSNVGASLEFLAPEPDPLEEGGASVWWKWTAPSSGWFQVNTFTSSFDTVLYVFAGSNLSTLVTIAANDEAGNTNQSRVNFNATSGVTYRFAVHGDMGETGSIALALGAGVVAPPNDLFADRIDLGSPGYHTTSQTNEGASREIDEITSIPDSDASIWWSWTAPSSGPVQIGTAASNFDTVLFVYTGDSLNFLTEIAADDDSGPNFTSAANFVATVGTTYQIAVHGSSGDTGTVDLHISMLSVYNTWLLDYPSLTGASALALADPDGDRLHNLAELVLGLDPTLDSSPAGNDPAKANVPQLIVTPAGIELHYTLNDFNMQRGAGLPIEVEGAVTFDFMNYTPVTPVSLGGDNYKIFTPFLELQKQLCLLVTDPNP